MLDRGPDDLADQTAAWLADLDATARLPGLDPTTWLTVEQSAELRAALPQIVALCHELAAVPMPITLFCTGLHMNNVAAGSRGPLFFDWTDACVGHPFFDLAVRCTAPTRPAPPRDAYLSACSGYGPSDRVTDAWHAVEVLAHLARP